MMPTSGGCDALQLKILLKKKFIKKQLEISPNKNSEKFFEDYAMATHSLCVVFAIMFCFVTFFIWLSFQPLIHVAKEIVFCGGIESLVTTPR